MTAQLPDPAALAEQLDHARATREHLDRVVAWLEQGLELLGRSDGEHAHELLPGPPADDAAVPERARPAGNEDAEYSRSDSSASSEEARSEPAAAPDAARAKTQAPRPPRTSSRDVEAKVLSAVISSNMPLSRAQIAERTNLTVNQLKHVLTRLVDDGRIIATGATINRRYQGGDHQPHSEAGARTAAGRARSAAKITDAVARVGLRDRVMKAVSADPCALDNQRLALALNADLADIADACSYLVGKNKLQLGEDGTYLRSAAEAAREVAAA